MKRLCVYMSQDEEFTNDEKCKLANALNLDIKEIDFFILTLTTVFWECVYHAAKPNVVFKVSCNNCWVPTFLGILVCLRRDVLK